MRFVIYGAGAIGGSMGGRLFEAGSEVVLIARGGHYQAMRDNGGLRVADPDRTRVLPIETVDHPSAVDWRDGDVVVLAMKTQDTVGALDALSACAPPATPIVCAQNGVENERLALRRFGHVYGMCVILASAHLEPGAVEYYYLPVPGLLDVGRYPTGVDDAAEAMASALRAAGFGSVAEADIMRWKYGKLLSNITNALDAAAGAAARRTDLAARARQEALDCYAAAGIDYADMDETRGKHGIAPFEMRPVEGRRHPGSSSWQSLARGTGAIEADYLNGEIVLLGRQHGVPTPVNALLQRVANDMARNGTQPETLTVDAVLAQLPAG
jgi:2-dehydropantoate 2-reductase